MPIQRLDLPGIFGAVTQALAQNQQSLDQADELNHDHGTNMVKTFQTITSALQEKQGKSDSVALAYAAKKLTKSSTSSSGKLYAQGLAQAATRFKGKRVDQRGAMDLLQMLIGGGQTSQTAGGDLLGTLLGSASGGGQTQPPTTAAGGDLLGALLGGMAGNQQAQQQTVPQSAGGDLIGSLLGGLTGNAGSSAGAGDGLDLGDLLNAGMAFFQAKQSGVNTLQALAQAFMSVSGMGRSAHRTESTELVINSFLQALASAGGIRSQ